MWRYFRSSYTVSSKDGLVLPDVDLWYRPTTAGICWAHGPPMILPDAFLRDAPGAFCRTISQTNKKTNHICFWPQIPISRDPIRPVGLMTPHGAFNRISRSFKAPVFLLMLLLRGGGISEFILRETIHYFSLFLHLLTLMFCWDRLDSWGRRDSIEIDFEMSISFFLSNSPFFFWHRQSIHAFYVEKNK